MYRGSGRWPVQPHPVELEPPFEPFQHQTANAWACVYNGWRDPTPLLKMLSELKESVGLTSRQAQLKVASRNPGNLLSLVARTDTQEFVDFVGAVSRKEAT